MSPREVVAKVVIVVAASFSSGIFKIALLVMMNDILATIAKAIETMNRQLMRRATILFISSRLPEIRSREPRSAIEIAVANEKTSVQKKARSIEFIFYNLV